MVIIIIIIIIIISYEYMCTIAICISGLEQ
jgi:hypothetical protein